LTGNARPRSSSQGGGGPRGGGGCSHSAQEAGRRYRLEYDDPKEKRFAGQPVRDAEEKDDDIRTFTKQKRFKILK
jgi:hypothetical protein